MIFSFIDLFQLNIGDGRHGGWVLIAVAIFRGQILFFWREMIEVEIDVVSSCD